MKKDCRNVDVLYSEIQRMCNNMPCTCKGCDLHEELCVGLNDNGCPDADFARLPEVADIVQKWSNENSELTMAEKFFALLPNAPRCETADIPKVCPYQLGWDEDFDCYQNDCVTCWSRPLKEVEE